MTLQELLARIEAATGPDRQLDGEIAFATHFRPTNALKESFDLHEAKHGYETSWIAHQAWRNQFGEPTYTASIDAALALVERALGKHWLYEIKSGIEKRCILWMLETDYDDASPPTGWHAESVPLAVIAALLRALITERT